MEYKSDVEILEAFAKNTHRTIEAQEIPYPRTGIRTTQKFKRTVYMPINSARESFFVWFNDAYSVIGQTLIYSGAFIPLPSKTAASLDIRNRFILDKLNPFSKTRQNRTGSNTFDSRAIIIGNPDTAAKRLLMRAQVQKQILLALEMAPHYHVAVNPCNVDFVPELKGRSVIAIMNRHGWEMKPGNIERMFARIKKFGEVINQRHTEYKTG